MGEAEWTASSWDKGGWREFLKSPCDKKDREMTRCIEEERLEIHC